MPSLSSVLGLPASLLLLLLLLLLSAQVTQAESDQQQQLILPRAIRKMGTDAGEKFHPHYYAFDIIDDDDDDNNNHQVSQLGTRARAAVPARAILEPHEQELLAANSSASIAYRAPYAAHFSASLDGRGGDDDDDEEEEEESGWGLWQRARLVEARLRRRDYSCPTGTSSCASIGYPDSCCQAGTTCAEIDDTGLGSVGCCPDGESCTGTIACSDGQEGCSSDSGGGCCISGYACASVGCTQSQTATATGGTRTSTTTTTTSEVTTTRTTTTSTSTPGSSSSSSTTTTTSGSGADASAPVRPTSGSGTTTNNPDYCPTGYYACSAVYGGGCCRTGRDCQTTDCPATASTTVVSGDSITVVVPVPTDATTTTTTSAETCATGWTMCASDATAGCCPSGYSCGTASCFGGATATVAKELPESGASRCRRGDVLVPALLGFAFGLGWI